MADYQHEDFDTYGYVEQIKFTTLNTQCGVTYTKAVDVKPKFTEVESFINQESVGQPQLTIPECKCLRK